MHATIKILRSVPGTAVTLRPMAAYRLTIRHGPRVGRESFDDLDQAVAALRERAEGIRADGPLEAVKAFRDYEPDRRVAARLELSSGGWLRGREAGLDVMGDGELVAYAGAVRKRRLEPRGDGTIFDEIRKKLDQ
jgi:hypothetical protein